MRKLFVAVAALGMLLTSCAKDDALSGGNGATVSFNIAQPTIASRALGTEDATKAYGTGYTAEDLQYAIFEAEKDATTGVFTIRNNGQNPISGVKDGFFSGNDLDNTLDGIRLVRGKHYIALFFAQSDATDAGNWAIDWTTRTMSLRDPEALKAQDETLDAFFTRVDFYVEPTSSNQSFDAELKRPFAQVNVLTDDAEAAQAAGLDVYQTSIEVDGVYTTMNLLDGSIDFDSATTLTYNMAEKGDYKMTVNGKDYDLLSMNYLLVNERKTVDITFRYNENAAVAGNDNTVFEAEFDLVPVERNYRTNIIGSLLTSAVSFQIVINPIFTDDIILDITKTPEQLLAEAAAAGGKYILASDVTLTESLEVAKDFELDLNGKTLTNAVDNATTDVIVVKEGATLIINGDGVVEAVSGNDGYAVISEGTVIINGGTYKTGLDATGDGNCTIYARGKGEIYINGGNFSTPEGDDTTFVLNKKDTDRDNTVIEVKGGTFTNFDPANNAAEGAGTNFVADGYVSKSADGKVWTVSAMTAEDKLVAEATKGGSYTLAEDMVLSQTLVVEKDLTLSLGGKTLSNKDYTMRSATPTTDVIIVKEGATLTIEGEGTVEAVSGTDGYAVISEGTVIIKGGTFKAGIDAEGAANAVVYARGKGKVYVEGGNFPNDNNTGFVLNKKDADRETTVIEVKGGTFTNFDPANNAAEGAGTNFCAEGYTTEAAEVDDKMVYTVVAAKTALATPAVETAVEGNVVTLTWEAVEGAAKYSVQVDDDVVEFVEATSYVFTGDWEVEYQFTVIAIAADTDANIDSEAAVVTATTEAEPVGPVGPAQITIQEFIDKADPNTVYELTGTITNIVRRDGYSNFYIKDESAEVYVYGLSHNGTNQNVLNTLGIFIPDEITIQGKFKDYNGTIEVDGAIYVSHKHYAGAWISEVSSDNVVFTAAGTENITVTLRNGEGVTPTLSGLTAPFSATWDAANSVVKVTSEATGAAEEQTLTIAVAGNSIDVKVSQLAAGGDVTTIGVAKLYNATTVLKGKTFTWSDFTFTFGTKNSSESQWNAGLIRYYKGEEMTITAPAGKKINKIVFSVQESKYCLDIDSNSGDVTLDKSKLTMTWEGDAVSSVMFTASAGQVRLSEIEIYTE